MFYSIPGSVTIADRNPTEEDVMCTPGTIWINTTLFTSWILQGILDGKAQWNGF